jgi:hypothetical protein
MDALINALQNPVVMLLIQLAFGALVKKWSVLASWPNRLIPLFNALLAVIIQLAGPGVAGAGVLGAGLFGWIAPRIGDVLLRAVVQTVLATGVHSTGKNLWQGIKQVAVAKAADSVR